MPNPYIDSLKIAKELENKAKEFQKKKKEVDDGIDYISNIVNILNKFGLDLNIDDYKKKIEESIRKRDIDSALQIIEEVKVYLAEKWRTFYSEDIGNRFEEMRRELGEKYDEFFLPLKKDNVTTLDQENIGKIYENLVSLDNFIRGKLGLDKITNFKNILGILEQDVESLLKRRDEINAKLKDILSKISQLELYAYKNKLDLTKIENIKKDAISYFRQDEFDKTVKLLEEYREKITEVIDEDIKRRIDSIIKNMELGNRIEVNVEEFEESIEKFKNGIYKNNLNQLSDNIKKMEQLLDRKLFDETVSKLSKLNADIRDFFGGQIPDNISENIKNIRELIKQNDLEKAFSSIKSLRQELEQIRVSQSSLREKLSVLKNSLASLHFEDESIKEIINKINNISSNRIIQNKQVEEIENDIQKVVSNFVTKISNEIVDAQLILKKFKRMNLEFNDSFVKEKDIVTLQKLLDIKEKVKGDLKEIGSEVEQRLKQNGIEMSCSEGSDIEILIKSINTCKAEYERIVSSKYDEYLKILSSFNTFFNNLGVVLPKIKNLKEILEKRPERKSDQIILEAEKAITEYREILNAVLINKRKQDENIEALTHSDALTRVEELLSDFNKELSDLKEHLYHRAVEVFTHDIGILQNGEPLIQNYENLLNPENIIKEKIARIMRLLDTLSWHIKINNETIEKISYQHLKDSLGKDIEEIFTKNPSYLLNPEVIRNIIKLNDFKFTPNDSTDNKEFEDIARSRIIQDISLLYGIGGVTNEGSLDNAIREKVSKIISEMRLKRSTTPLNISIGKIESIMNENPRQACINAVALYDEYIEKGFARKELTAMLSRLRTISNEYSQEIPWFQDEFKKVAGMMVLGQYADAIKKLDDIVTRASKDLPYIKYLKDSLNKLNSESQYLKEEDKRELLNIKRMIIEYKFREAFDSIKNINEKIENMKNEAWFKGSRDIIEMALSLALTNAFIGLKINENQIPNDVRALLNYYQKESVANAMNEIGNINEVLNSKIDFSSITIGNQTDIGMFLFNLKSSLLLRLLKQIEGLLEEIKENSKMIIFTDAYNNFIENFTTIGSNTSLVEFYNEVIKKYNDTRSLVKKWAEKSLNSKNESIDENNNIDNLVRTVIVRRLEGSVNTPLLYNPDEIKKRIDFLERMGYKKKDNLETDALIDEIEIMSEKFKTSLKLDADPIILKNEKKFALKCVIVNDGSAPVYDLSLSFNNQGKSVGDIDPGETKEVLLNHDNLVPTILMINGLTLDWKEYTMNREIPAVIKYSKYRELSRENCSYCKGIILAGVDALRCNLCGATYHYKCAQRSKKCVVCGNDFNL